VIDYAQNRKPQLVRTAIGAAAEALGANGRLVDWRYHGQVKRHDALAGNIEHRRPSEQPESHRTNLKAVQVTKLDWSRGLNAGATPAGLHWADEAANDEQRETTLEIARLWTQMELSSAEPNAVDGAAQVSRFPEIPKS
jgi:hypothetical protein